MSITLNESRNLSRCSSYATLSSLEVEEWNTLYRILHENSAVNNEEPPPAYSSLNFNSSCSTSTVTSTSSVASSVGLEMFQLYLASVPREVENYSRLPSQLCTTPISREGSEGELDSPSNKTLRFINLLRKLEFWIKIFLIVLLVATCVSVSLFLL